MRCESGVGFGIDDVFNDEQGQVGLPEPGTFGLLALALAGMWAEACVQTAVHAVQMHGGIGFTWDNDTHLWFKRAKSSEILFGDANEHREKMMQAWAN